VDFAPLRNGSTMRRYSDLRGRTMDDMTRILSIGQDKQLLDTRSLLFQKAHCHVNTALDYQQVYALPDCDEFAVVVVGQMDPASKLRELTQLIRRRWPRTRIVILSQSPPPLEDALYDDRVDALHPGELVARVVRLAQEAAARLGSPVEARDFSQEDWAFEGSA
jgi:DNA-binding response OmpR family regulator